MGRGIPAITPSPPPPPQVLVLLQKDSSPQDVFLNTTLDRLLFLAWDWKYIYIFRTPNVLKTKPWLWLKQIDTEVPDTGSSLPIHYVLYLYKQHVNDANSQSTT